MADEEKKGSVLADIIKDYTTTTLVPQAKIMASNMISDILYTLADMGANVMSRRIIGKDAPTISRTGATTAGTSNQANALKYQGKYPNHIVTAPSNNQASKSAVDLEVIPIYDEAQAKEIKDKMVQCICDLGYVRVADYYSLCKKSPLAQHYRFGWINPIDIHYRPQRELRNNVWTTVFYFDLPEPKEIRNIR